MAVQAQYPSNVLNRSEQERKSMDFAQAAPPFLNQSTTAASVFFSNGENPRKRPVREVVAVGTTAAPPPPQNQAINLMSTLQWQNSPSLTPVSLAESQAIDPPPPLVSNGLRLAFRDQDLAAQITQQNQEIDRFLRAQGEQLRRALAERWRTHSRALLVAAGNTAARRLREKEAERERAVIRAAELEDRLARLRAESEAWQAKARAQQASAAYLHAQLQAATTPPEHGGEFPAAEDAESANVDPDRRGPRAASCRVCGRSPASVVLLPCRHLCLCSDCDIAAQSCPVCGRVGTGSIQVSLS